MLVCLSWLVRFPFRVESAGLDRVGPMSLSRQVPGASDLHRWKAGGLPAEITQETARGPPFAFFLGFSTFRFSFFGSPPPFLHCVFHFLSTTRQEACVFCAGVRFFPAAPASWAHGSSPNGELGPARWGLSHVLGRDRFL